MPWSQRDRPSAALGSLAAYVRRELPDWTVETHSAFLDVASGLGLEAYDAISVTAYTIGELLYAALFYPERAARVREHHRGWRRQTAPGSDEDLDRDFASVQSVLQKHITRLADRLAGHEVVGLTTSFGQLFANLTLAREIKARTPATKIVLGGSTVSSRVGPSLLAEYDFVDGIVQGEGEQPLVTLLAAVGRGEEIAGAPGVLSRGARAPAELSEKGSLDELPLPDFDEYAARAEELELSWALPIEGSRGCWWDRTRRTGNAKDTCLFCNLNVQWAGYREKSPERLAAEMAALARRYSNLRAYFVDNVLRSSGIPELCDAVLATGMSFDIFYEMRVNLRPHDFLRLWEAGVTATQFGIESLSTSYLRRIGKGATVLQNLQAMRLCAEFRVANLANLITDFPGATQAEVDETVRALESSALGFQPLNLSKFMLGIESSVETLREQLGVTNVRNADIYRVALPPEVWSRLQLFDLTFDLVRPGVDWAPVVAAQERWLALHGTTRPIAPLLIYEDGGDFLVVRDRRFGPERGASFDEGARDIYLTCTEIHSFDQLARKYRAHGIDDDDLKAALDHFVGERIMHEENGRYLSLAIARTPELAARRIRAAWEARTREPSRHIRLPVAS
jgi:ribosomal peptide maturation radical SAM protein 1